MDTLLRTLKAMAEPSRLRLLALCAQGEFTVSELVHVLGQSQPRVSRHLKILCDAGLLRKIREGSWMLYSFSPEKEKAAVCEQVLLALSRSDRFLIHDFKRLDMLKADQSRAAADYFRLNAKQWDEIRKLHVDEDKVEEAVKKTFLSAPIDSFLDIGTGTGRMLELIAAHAKKADGVDQSFEMLAVARANLDNAQIKNYTVRHGSMYQLPASEGQYDAVCIHQVLHFSDQPNRVIAEAARVLQPGGKLVVIDFSSHEMEALRNTYHHRRLGFSDGEFVHWFQQNGISYGSPIHLYGGPLTVTLWVGYKKVEI